MFDALKAAFKRASRIFAPVFQQAGHSSPTRNEMRLDSDAWTVKQKLGKAFFSKRLGSRTRQRRISDLTQTERSIARSKGWI